MQELSQAQEAFTRNPSRETFGDYYEVVLRQWREARANGWYCTKVMLENHLVRLGFASERHNLDAADIAKERGIIKPANAAPVQPSAYIPDCEYQNVDGCCLRPDNATPECHADACPLAPAQDRMAVGYCSKCGGAHSLIDGLCYDCRPRFVDHYG